MPTYKTGIIESNISSCDSIEELQEQILPLLQDLRAKWVEKIEEIIHKKGYTCRDLARLCQVSEPAVRKWRKGSLPQSRNMYIRIGFAAGYNLDEMNAFLKRYGRCPQLYVRSLEDSVCIFVLQSNVLPRTYETYCDVLELLRNQMQGDKDVKEAHAYTTSHLNNCFSNLKSLEEMFAFVKENAASFKQAYSKLYNYVIMFLRVNLGDDPMVSADGRKPSFHAMANESQWSSSLRHCISEIRNKKWFPLRHKIISLGLHLNMDGDGINQMLQYAQMEPLYVKNPIEAAVVWAIEEAKLSTFEDEIIMDGSSDLCEFVKSVLLKLQLSDSEYLIDDL